MKNVKIIIALLFTGTLFAQSPWTKKKNEAYLQLSFSSISNYTELFGNPDYGTDREITDNTLQLYAEYGVSDKTTLFANVPFKMVKSGNPTLDVAIIPEGSESSLGNIQLGVKHNFYNKKWLISGQVGVEANTGSYNAATGLRTGYDAWTITPLVLVGRGFNNWYIQAFTGVDIRTNDYSSAYKLGGELGYKAIDWLWVAGFLDGVASFQNGETVIPTSNALTGLYVNNQSYAAFGLKLIGEINDKFGANAGIGGAFGGRNVAKKPAFSLGLYYKL
ncbi:transporter [Tenacibaculum xiamenense]|uniref:transporter n=1 Tax=Tenacibaculum xiamenense TaxID=1261553 RepID=UPI0038966494